MSKSSKQDIQCCVWDFTSFDINLNKDVIIEKLKSIGKKYCFQLEKGEKKGKNHWQGRISLKEKKRQNQVIQLFNDIFKKFHISRTSAENKNNDFYVCKEETRLEGPYKDTDIKVPRDVKKMDKLYPWQERLKRKLSNEEDRIIDVVIDGDGNTGKTSFTRYMMIHHGAKLLPMCNDYKDILRMVMCIGERKLYFIDMPRAMSKDKLFQFFSAVETVKGGYAYDDRYEFKDMIFDPPRICIFTNSEPSQRYLTQDRWRFWTIQNNKLVKYSTEPLFLD